MKNFNLIKTIMVLSIFMIVINSCQDETDISQNDQVANNEYTLSGKFEENPKERMRNAILELTNLQKNIIKDKNALSEVYYLCQNEFYTDNYAGLNDLLHPFESNVYKKANVPKEYIGSYKKAFSAEMSKNTQQYPNLKYISERPFQNIEKNKKNNNNSSANQRGGFDISFYETADITFYIPYTTDDLEAIINPYDGTTFVPGVLDAMTALGYKFNYDTEEFDEVNTDDNYANEKMTILIEPNNTDYLIPSESPIDPNSNGSSGDGSSTANEYTGECWKLEGTNHEYVRQVFVGHAKLKDQYDRYISFTGNGGGSEIIVGRVGSREHLEFTDNGNDVVVSSLDLSFQIDFSRKDIRKRRDKWVGALWDPNWECAEDPHEQLFFVYEDDNTSPIDFDFSGIKWGDETYGEVSLNYTVRTKDEIIRQIEREETEFFATNLLDQGCGCKNGEHSFADRCWAWYDCGTPFQYTMPHRWVVVQTGP